MENDTLELQSVLLSKRAVRRPASGPDGGRFEPPLRRERYTEASSVFKRGW
jgi:hypothetical protein